MPRPKLAEEKRDITRKNISDFRREFGRNVGNPDITQREFCEIAGIEYGTYTKYEGGKSRPTADAAQKIASVTGHRMEDIYSPDPQPADAETARAAYRAFKERHVEPSSPLPTFEMSDGDGVLQLFAYSASTGEKVELSRKQRPDVEDLMQQLLAVVFPRGRRRMVPGGGWIEEDGDGDGGSTSESPTIPVPTK